MRGGKRIALLLIFLLGMPIAGLALARAARWRAELAFREQMERVVPASTRSRVQTLPLAQLCAIPGAETDDACEPYAPAAVLRLGSIVTAASGLLLLAGIVAARIAARADRRLLVALFGPGMQLTILATIGLTILHALLALVFLSVLLSLRAKHVPTPFFLLPALLGAAYGSMALARSLRGAVERVRTHVIGEAVTPAAAPALWQLVDDLADRMGALGPDRIIAGLGVGFFVTEADVSTPGGVSSGRTLFVSLPMARILTVDELASIIGHELGHFRGEDTAYSRLFAPIYRGTQAAMGALQSSARGGQLLLLLPAFAILGVFLDALARAERHHSRARELLADAAGAEATTPRALATALVKTHAFAPFWPAVAMSVQIDAFNARRGLPDSLRTGPASAPDGWRNVTRLFVDVIRAGATAERLRDIDQTRTSHPTDTHPPLAARLDALGLEIAAVADDALIVEPETPASTLFADATALEERLTAFVRNAAAEALRRAPRS